MKVFQILVPEKLEEKNLGLDKVWGEWLKLIDLEDMEEAIAKVECKLSLEIDLEQMEID
ncbi:MAG: hypothetical protein N3E48_01680 [Candidatus Bathyarchaeota archaeon]|nr:hypothetical protein [Candidatus Bathyarchaeota archaeon]